MKYLLSIIALIIMFSPLQAAHKEKHKKNPKQYIKGYEKIFMYPHGMYLPYPGKLYKVQAIYWSRSSGYYTYKSKMKKFPLSWMKYYDWSSPQR